MNACGHLAERHDSRVRACPRDWCQMEVDRQIDQVSGLQTFMYIHIYVPTQSEFPTSSKSSTSLKHICKSCCYLATLPIHPTIEVYDIDCSCIPISSKSHCYEASLLTSSTSAIIMFVIRCNLDRTFPTLCHGPCQPHAEPTQLG